MRNLMRGTLAAAALAGAALFAASAAPAAPTAVGKAAAPAERVRAETEGTWTASRRDDGRIHLSLQWEQSTWGRAVELAELRGLTDAQVAAAASTPVAFAIRREAGEFELEGVFREGRGAGHFRFRANPEFAAALRAAGVTGVDGMSEREQMILAWSGASTASVRDFGELGLRPLSLEDLTSLSIHHVTPEYVGSLRAVGLEGTRTADEVVELRIHRVTAEYVRELRELGYGGLSRQQVLEMGIHGVDADHVRQMRELFGHELSPRAVVELRIHRVTPEYVRELRAAGLGELSHRGAIDMRIHRISARYVRELAELGYRDLPRRQLLDMGIHGVTPAFIRELREAGYRDLPAETLVRMKIHGIDAEFVRGTRRRG